MKKCNSCGKLHTAKTDICECGSMSFTPFNSNHAVEKVKGVSGMTAKEPGEPKTSEPGIFPKKKKKG